jgi:hypothetical protein
VTEAGRLRDDAVRPAGHHDVPVGERHPLGDGKQPFEPFEQQVARVPQLQRETGVQDVRGGQPEVHPAARGADGGGDDLHERGHVVPGDALDLGHALGVERRRRPDLARVGFRDDAEPGQGLGDEDLDLEPLSEPRVVGPDGGHLGQDVPRDHGTAGCSLGS